MKKRFAKLLLTIICLLSSTNVAAYDFEVDGIYYDVLSWSDLTCEVVGGPNGYIGDVVIPTTINYSDRILTVVSIANAFYDCRSLTSVTIPSSVTKIGDFAFTDCTSLVNLTIPNSVTSIGEGAFEGCTSLASVTIPNSVTKLGEAAFYDCRSLTSVTISNSVTTINKRTFTLCEGLTSVTIPNSVTQIGEDAFSGCKGLTSVILSNSVTKIEEYAFYYCNGLTSLTIPNSVTKIGAFAFKYCSSLTSVTLGNSVHTIETGAFEYCDTLTTLYSFNTTPPQIDKDNFTNNQWMSLNVYVPQEALAAYQSADVWKEFWNLQGFNPTGIESISPDTHVVKEIKRYNAAGRETDSNHKGLTIIKMSDGTTKKVMVK